MTQTIDTCDTMRNNLIAAAVGLQQCTKTAANVIPLPGTGRFVTIGTPAEVVGLLRKQVLPVVDQAAEDKSETDIVQDVADFFRAFGFEVRDELGAQSVFSVVGSLDSAAQLLEFCLGSGEHPQAAARDVLAERRRQVSVEGYTPEDDDGYRAAELPRAAAAYILSGGADELPAIWPWAKAYWKPRDARANYVRAAALLLAEIERIDRAEEGGAA